MGIYHAVVYGSKNRPRYPSSQVRENPHENLKNDNAPFTENLYKSLGTKSSHGNPQ